MLVEEQAGHFIKGKRVAGPQEGPPRISWVVVSGRIVSPALIVFVWPSWFFRGVIDGYAIENDSDHGHEQEDGPEDPKSQ